MFGIRVFTPPLTGDDGWPHAGAELRVGNGRMRFRIDLRYWRIADYERQWKEGIARLTSGAASSALVSRYSGPRGASHSIWALWRIDGQMYVQPQYILQAELASPFDPLAPYAHTGVRIPAVENNLPLPEWQVPMEHVFAATLGVRWPFVQ